MKLVTITARVWLTGDSDFNPHEREARDVSDEFMSRAAKTILIHTSVKLVTYCVQCVECGNRF